MNKFILVVSALVAITVATLTFHTRSHATEVGDVVAFPPTPACTKLEVLKEVVTAYNEGGPTKSAPIFKKYYDEHVCGLASAAGHEVVGKHGLIMMGEDVMEIVELVYGEEHVFVLLYSKDLAS